MRTLLFVSSFLLTLLGNAQTKAMLKAWKDAPRAYALYDSEGIPSSWDAMVDRALQSDVVCFGELHDDATMHWLQLELVSALIAQGARPVLGAEMLEADDQLVLDEYLQGIVNEDKLKAAANLWPNHATDYQPLIDLAQGEGLSFVATNVPRRYASFVYREGLGALDSLSDEAKRFLPPLPVPFNIDLPGYQAMLAMGGGHGGETLPMAQAIKDATMAHFIMENLPEPGQGPFVHFNGAYHSQNQEGIVWYLRHASSDIDVLTIHGHRQANVLAPDSASLGMGDFLLLTNENLTKTH